MCYFYYEKTIYFNEVLLIENTDYSIVKDVIDGTEYTTSIGNKMNTLSVFKNRLFFKEDGEYKINFEAKITDFVGTSPI